MEKNGQTLDEEFDKITFSIACLNAQQLSVKVFMNTFYGLVGQQHSSFFMAEVASSVTLYGRKNVKFAFKKVTNELGCTLY